MASEAVAPPSLSNGVTDHGQIPPNELAQLLQALEAIYHPASTNQTRQAASAFLEDAKRRPHAPQQGFSLAMDSSKELVLRHYGLSMLDYYIKYTWQGDAETDQVLRDYVTQLAQNLRPEDPGYVRNKVAQLWTEVAKRSWGLSWLNMDEMLNEFWNSSLLHKSFALYVLETLSEEVFAKEEGGVRGNELSQACIEIFTPASVLAGRAARRREEAPVLRYGEDGWLKRLCKYLDSYFGQTIQIDERSQAVAVKVLLTIRSTLNWISPKAVSATNVILYLCAALDSEDVKIKDAGVDSLNAVCGRMNLHDGDLKDLICPLLTGPTVSMFRKAAGRANLDPNDIDFDTNTFVKKYAEFISHLGGWVVIKPGLLAQCPDMDLESLLSLFWDITAHESLLISIPLMHLWPRLLRCSELLETNAIRPHIPQLLQLCTSRLIRYEQLPDEVTEPTFLFLAEDFDTLPERHAFLGNYRRLCVDVIELIVRKHAVEAITHISAQSTATLERLAGQTSRTAQDFSRTSVSLVMIESQIQVVDAAVKGFLKWLGAQDTGDPQQNERDRNQILESFRQWCEMVFRLNLMDPEILRRLVPVAVTISTKVLKTMPGFGAYVAEQLLNITLKEDPAYPQYSDAVKTLQHVSTIELQRMAMVFADQFLEIFDSLQRRIEENISMHNLDLRPQLGYRAFLLIIIQRASSLDDQTRVDRMQQMLMPVKEGWQDPTLTAAASSFESFCEFLGLSNLAEYLSTRNFHSVRDWSEQQLDHEGQELQALILDRNEHIPIRLTKAMLAATTERVEQDSPAMEVSRMLWSTLMPSILPNLLQMISHAQAFYNLEKWSGLPEEMQRVIKRILTDRFWQVGISTESKDDFFAKVNNSKNTYEGLASTIRGTMRQVRETAYYILYGFSRFKNYFYAIADLPQPLSQALYANAHYLSPHHFSVLLTISGQLIDGCPQHLRDNFLPSMVSHLFRQIDAKLGVEWTLVNQRKDQAAEDDNLGDEMRTESILRQLTYSAVQLAFSLLDQHRVESPSKSSPSDQQDTKVSHMFRFVISHSEILEPLLLFTKSALRFRDTRSVGATIRLLRGNLLPTFRDQGEVHTYLCHDVLQAAILSLHEPYFVDCQKDLASLIGQIIQLDEMISRNVILQLPGLGEQEQKVDHAMQQVRSSTNDRQARAWVLELLKDVRGVSIHEMGRMERAPVKKKVKEEYMTMDDHQEIQRGGSPALEGVADMFQH